MLMVLRKITSFFLFIFLIILITSPVFADMIYLNNGEKIEGIIEIESAVNLTLDIGSGTIILKKGEIDHIDRYGNQKQDALREQWRRKYIQRLDFIPGDFKRLFRQLKAVEGMREKAIEDNEEKNTALGQIDKLDEILEGLNIDLAESSKSLITAKPEKNAKKYNSLIERFNSLQAEIKLDEYKKNLLTKKVVRLDEKISDYLNKLSLFKESFKKESKAADFSSEDEKLLMIINTRLSAIGDDFKKHSISYNQKGSAISVEALLNGVVKASFILDTGASIVVISKRIADKLGLELDNESSSTFVTLADGRKVKANIVLLDSIAIGNLKAKNVQAAVLKNEEAVSEDGLLGMTFLKNFMIKIDPKNGRLVLEEFTPQQ